MQLVVTGIGAVTSLALDVENSCAAIRAGISRTQAIDAMRVMDGDAQGLEPAVGHPVSLCTDGFGVFAAWANLGGGALADLITRLGPAYDAGSFWPSAALLVVTPVPLADRLLTEELSPEELREAVVPIMLASEELPAPGVITEMVPAGHVGTILALRRARQLLGEGTARRVVLVAVDSYLDVGSLTWLTESERLKEPTNPTGLAPGEAGVAILLEEGSTARTAGREILGQLSGEAVESPRGAALEGKPDNGHALYLALKSSLRLAGPKPQNLDVVVDLNGENWRAHELSCALLKAKKHLSFAPRTTLIPALSVGETGAASGALGICLALESQRRHYGAPGGAVLCSTSEDGTTASVLVSTVHE